VMVELDNIQIFVKVAQFESISKAALSLGMPISTLSRRLSVLESGLGVALVPRTTRRVTLTPQGREYFNQCQEPLTLIQEAERVLTQAQKNSRFDLPVMQRSPSRLEGDSRNITTLRVSRTGRSPCRAS
jgi:DNA-binding transcriptional LysR family regulator